MQQFILSVLFVLYTMASLVILFLAILLPLYFGMKDFPSWIAFIIYPLALIIGVTQSRCLLYFHQKIKLY